MKLDSLSVEYLHTTVTASVAPTSVPQFAFKARFIKPIEGDWINGTWMAAAVQNPDGTWRREARTPLIGAGPADLAVGSYWAWVRQAEGSETVVEHFDDLEIV